MYTVTKPTFTSSQTFMLLCVILQEVGIGEMSEKKTKGKGECKQSIIIMEYKKTVLKSACILGCY